MKFSVRGSLTNFEREARKVGNTPITEFRSDDHPNARFLIKTEGNNPTGSVKDRACVAMLKAMLRDEQWDDSKGILDASSGNMGCSIAYFGNALGVPVRIVSSAKLTREKRVFMEYFGARVETMGAFTVEGNEYCRAEQAREPDRWHFLDQLHNQANPEAHVAATGPEILAQVPDVAAVVGSIGSGGTLLGVAKYLKQHDADIQIVAVEAASGTRIPGVAALVDGDYRTPFIDQGYREGLFDLSLRAAHDDVIRVACDLPQIGVFGGLQTAAVVLAAAQAVDQLGIVGDVVVISGDSGWKNIEAISEKVLAKPGAGPTR